MNTIDLHCHTTASDGALSPSALVGRAARVGVQTIAITDHDTVAGVAEALDAGRHFGVEVIPGVEINTDVPSSEVHILGYFLNYTDEVLLASLARLQESRIGRAHRMAEVLTSLGAPVDVNRILALAHDGSVGRPHVAQALIEAGHVHSYAEAFERYIGRNSPAYVDRMKFTPANAVDVIRKAGGLPVLAHPVFYDRLGGIRTALPLDEMLPPLVEAGLGGLEVYYRGYDAITIEYLLAATRRYGLVATGGTDFHGPRSIDPDVGGIHVPRKVLRRLREAWERLA